MALVGAQGRARMSRTSTYLSCAPTCWTRRPGRELRETPASRRMGGCHTGRVDAIHPYGLGEPADEPYLCVLCVLRGG